MNSPGSPSGVKAARAPSGRLPCVVCATRVAIDAGAESFQSVASARPGQGAVRRAESVESGDLAGRHASRRQTCVTRKQTETPIATGSSEATVVQRALRVSL